MSDYEMKSVADAPVVMQSNLPLTHNCVVGSGGKPRAPGIRMGGNGKPQRALPPKIAAQVRELLTPEVKQKLSEALEARAMAREASGEDGEALPASVLEEMIIQILIMSKGPKTVAQILTPEVKAALKQVVARARMKHSAVQHIKETMPKTLDGSEKMPKIIDYFDGSLIDCVSGSGLDGHIDMPGVLGTGGQQPRTSAPAPKVPKGMKDAISNVFDTLREKGVSSNISSAVEELRELVSADDGTLTDGDDSTATGGGADALRAALAPRIEAMIETVAAERVGRHMTFDEVAFRAKIEKAIETYGAAIDRIVEGGPATIKEAAALVGALETILGRSGMQSLDGEALDGFSSDIGIVLNTALEGNPEALVSTLVEELGERFFQTTFDTVSQGDFGAEVAGRLAGTVTDATAPTLRGEAASDTTALDIDGETVVGEADAAAATTATAASESMSIAFAARAPGDPEIIVEYRDASGNWVQAASSISGDTTVTLPAGVGVGDIRMRYSGFDTLLSDVAATTIYGSSGEAEGASISYSPDNKSILTMGRQLTVTPGVAPTGFDVVIQTSISSPDISTPGGIVDFLAEFDVGPGSAPDGVLDVEELMAAGIGAVDAERLVRMYGGSSTSSDGKPGIPTAAVAGEPGIGLPAMALDMKGNPAAPLFGFWFNDTTRQLSPDTPNTRHANTYAKVSGLIHSVILQRDSASADPTSLTYQAIAEGGITQAEFKTAMTEIFGESAVLDDASVAALFTNFGTPDGMMTQAGLLEAFDSGALSLSADDVLAPGAAPTAIIDPTITPPAAGAVEDTTHTRYQNSNVAIPESILNGTGPTDGIYDPPYVYAPSAVLGFGNKMQMLPADMTRTVSADGTTVTWAVSKGGHTSRLTMKAGGKEDRYLSDYKDMMSEGRTGRPYHNTAFSNEATTEDGGTIQLWTPREFQFRNRGRPIVGAPDNKIATSDVPIVTIKGQGETKGKDASVTDVDVIQSQGGGQPIFVITASLPNGKSEVIAYQPKTAAEAKFYKNLYVETTGEAVPVFAAPATPLAFANQLAELPPEVQDAVLDSMEPFEASVVRALMPASAASDDDDYESLMDDITGPAPAGESKGEQTLRLAGNVTEVAELDPSAGVLEDRLKSSDPADVQPPETLGPLSESDIKMLEDYDVDAYIEEIYGPPNAASEAGESENIVMDGKKVEVMPRAVYKRKLLEVAAMAAQTAPPEERDEKFIDEAFRMTGMSLLSVSTFLVGIAREGLMDPGGRGKLSIPAALTAITNANGEIIGTTGGGPNKPWMGRAAGTIAMFAVANVGVDILNTALKFNPELDDMIEVSKNKAAEIIGPGALTASALLGYNALSNGNLLQPRQDFLKGAAGAAFMVIDLFATGPALDAISDAFKKQDTDNGLTTMSRVFGAAALASRGITGAVSFAQYSSEALDMFNPQFWKKAKAKFFAGGMITSSALAIASMIFGAAGLYADGVAVRDN